MLLRREVPLSRSVPLRRRLASAASGLLLVAATAGFCGVTPAQEPQSEQQLRAEAAQLRQMVKELKVEVLKLQQQVQWQEDLLKVLPPGIYPVQFRRTGDGGQAQPGGSGQNPSGVFDRLDYLPTAKPVEGAQPPACTESEVSAEAPDKGKPAGVPVLKDIPILGNLFHADGTRTYTVQAGDTLAGIASKQLGSAMQFEVILQLNPDLDPRRMRPGQQIMLPAHAHDRDAAAPVHAPQDHAVGQAPPPAPQPAADRSLSDLLDVVTRTIELRGQLEIAQGEYEQQSELAKQGRTDQQSLRVAGIKLRTLKQQVDVADRLLRGELESAQEQLKRLEQMQKAGVLSSGDRELRGVRNFVKVLMGAF